MTGIQPWETVKDRFALWDWNKIANDNELFPHWETLSNLPHNHPVLSDRTWHMIKDFLGYTPHRPDTVLTEVMLRNELARSIVACQEDFKRNARETACLLMTSMLEKARLPFLLSHTRLEAVSWKMLLMDSSFHPAYAEKARQVVRNHLGYLPPYPETLPHELLIRHHLYLRDHVYKHWSKNHARTFVQQVLSDYSKKM